MIGEVISERYKIVKYLGGGMSSVYLATDIILNREVVVKMIKADPLDKEKSVRRFQREVESTIQLSHPNIVSVLDVDETDEYHILVTEVVHGVNLKEHILKNSPLDIDEVIRIAMMTLRGIEHAHDRGIIHRDIKPQNILLDTNGRVKITDFGIAKALSETRMTETNQVIGSVQYISPEQAKGQNTDERTDIYSFGVMLFELLTGRLPYEAETAVSVALKHISEPFPNISEYRDIPVGLKNIIMKCTEKEPVNRYRHADDVLSALVYYKDISEPYEPVKKEEQEKTMVTPIPAAKPSEPVKAAEEEPVSKENNEAETEPKKKRRKWPWILFILLFLLAAAAVIVYLLWPRQSPTVSLENLQNATVEEAEEYLLSEDLVAGEVSETYDENFEEGMIIETEPVSGTDVERGSSVDMLVSLGEEPYTMNDHVGDMFEDVKTDLEAAGFTNIQSETEYSDEAPGTILEQSIAEGEELTPDSSPITFTVSDGVAPIPITNYAGTSLEAARAELESQGFIVNVTTEVYSDEVPEGAIVSQDPSYGDFLPGSQINVIVSLGEEPPEETTYQISLNIPYPESEESGNSSDSSEEDSDSESDAEAEPLEAEIYIEDKDNDIEEVSETIEITEDTNHTISLILQEGTSGQYRVEVDGKEVIKETVDNK
ncbi:Serine/threonine-protein kinase PrkC [Jeotgalicoccus aerolatus]|uniref:Serine/threonine-protein kinase n=1 Tax=Jeotgalicoccus aerolatus TaxID=709510 RepID=A0ABS4HKL0_9STAP|nr:Stk1 family PASTA domain-containing Ser/Thr kinase [Jeotgalicoccus aerolatus]MBP1951436.1 serine/threonine-protein kinase [Jeotgalicoccus aerolatus]GGD97530.1 serine/threonine-protein kinase PrkC [Jeotgalicoccus aerolatus]CAD2076655.1 Serine/threonine-protein kinase PrkC [Jeotgalicoccus aerolatus]